MPTFNVQMLTNILASALTATVASWLSYLAAWSHFSSESNTALATVIAAGLAIIVGQLLTILINRWSVLVDSVARSGTQVITDQRTADSLPDNPDVMGPRDATVTPVPREPVPVVVVSKVGEEDTKGVKGIKPKE